MKVNQSKRLNLYEKVLIFSMVTGSGLSFHKVYLYHIFMIINFFLIFYYMRINNYKFTIENKVIIIFFIYSFFHIFFTKNYMLALRNQIYIICGVSVFYTIKILLKKNNLYVLKIIKNIFIFIVIIGSLETLHIIRWYNSPYDIKLSIPSVFYDNTNNYATVLIIIFPFLFFMKNSLKKSIILLISVYLLVKSESRTNNIALIIEILIFTILIFYKSKIYKRIFLFFSGIFSIVLLKDKIIDKFYLLYELFNASSVRKDSVGIRKQLILNILFELKKIKVFLFGIGGGNVAIIHKAKMGVLASSHSFFLDLLVEYGIFIFILLGIYYSILIYKNLKIYLKTNNSINGSLFISLIGFAIGLNSMSGVIYFFPFWCLLGVADFYVKKGVEV